MTNHDTLGVINRFSEAVNTADLNAVMSMMTDDCVFENTHPPPDGARHVGQVAVRAAWDAFFRSNPGAWFDADEVIVHEDRCTVRWTYRKTKDGKPWHLRGVDVFRVREGRVSEKLSYVKG